MVPNVISKKEHFQIKSTPTMSERTINKKHKTKKVDKSLTPDETSQSGYQSDTETPNEKPIR